ncbi:FUSC family protein [Craterilacuibacter sinensis]|nr:FUSC family protein [Craterilacuibacter sinensis]
MKLPASLRPIRADIVRGVLFMLGMGLPVWAGIVLEQPVLGAFASLGAMLALSLDPRRSMATRIPSIMLGTLLVVAAAALGLVIAGNRPLALAGLFVISWLAGLPRPDHAYLSLLGKYAASALVLAEMGFPATVPIGAAYVAGAMLGLALSLMQAYLVASVEPGSSPWDEMNAVISGDSNGPLYGLTLPLTILLATWSAVKLGVVEAGWVGLTVLFVMHVDDAQAWRRIWQRVAGTLLGVVLAALLLTWVGSPLGLVLLIALLAAAYPMALRRNYLAFSLVVTALVLLVIDVVKLESGGDAGLLGWRFVDTLLGCAWVALALFCMRALRRFWPARRGC